MSKMTIEVVHAIIDEVAKAHGMTGDEIRETMNEAYDKATRKDEKVRGDIAELVGHEGKPSPEEYLIAVVREVKRRRLESQGE